MLAQRAVALQRRGREKGRVLQRQREKERKRGEQKGVTWIRGVSLVGRKQIIDKVTFKQMRSFPLCFLISGVCHREKEGVVKPNLSVLLNGVMSLFPSVGKA